MTTQIKAGVIAANAVNSSELASGALSGQTFTGDIAFDTTTLVIDSTNNRVGIGTNNPVRQLMVQDSSANCFVSVVTGTGNVAGLMLGDTDDETQGRVNYDNSTSSMAFYTADTEKVRIDQNGNVGIGNDNPSYKLSLKDTTQAGTTIQLFRTGSAAGSMFINGGLAFGADGGNGDTQRMVISSSTGNVGIGTPSPSQILSLEASDTTVRFMEAKNSAGSMLVGVNGSGNAFVSGQTSGKPLIFETNNTERMRIDSSGIDVTGTTTTNNLTIDDGVIEFDKPSVYGFRFLQNDAGNDLSIQQGDANNANYQTRLNIDASGNLLVGKTSQNNTTAGAELLSSGKANITRDGNTTALFNRLTSDGDIVTFAKDSSSVGSIGTKNGDLIIGTTDVGLRFHDSGDNIRPANMDTGAVRDAAVDLGLATGRFKDLYLSGQALVQSGGTSAPSFAFVNDTDTGISRPTTDAINIVNGGTEKWRFTSGGDLQMKSTNSAAIFAANGGETTGYARTSGSGFIGIFGENNYSSCGAHVEIATNSNFGWSPLYINRYLANSGEDDRLIQFNINGSEDTGTIEYNFSNSNFELLNSSDYRLKSNVVDYTGGLATINNIQVRKFTKNNVDNVVGFIAHELQEHIPSAVKGEKDAVGTIVETGEEGAIYQKVSKEHLVPYLVSAIQEQQTIIDDLKSRIETLEG